MASVIHHHTATTITFSSPHHFTSPQQHFSLSLTKPFKPFSLHSTSQTLCSTQLISLCPHKKFQSFSPPKTAQLARNSTELLNLLKLSVKDCDFQLLRAVHASILRLYENENTYLCNALISAYLKLGFDSKGYNVFMGILRPDVVSYSTLISGFAKFSRENEAIEAFFEMRMEGVEPNEFSFVAVLSACIRIFELDLGMQVHGLVVKLGYLGFVYVVNALMGLYGNCGCVDEVIRLFNEMNVRDTASLNTLMSSVVKELSCEEGLHLFRDLNRSYGFKVDQFTLLTILTACTGCYAVLEGRAAHGHSIRMGLDGTLNLNNALIKFYTKCGRIYDVEALFERTGVADVVTWTEMISAYMEFGLVDSAVEMFEKMPEKNYVSYNALLAGFCQNGEGSKALDLFIKMVHEALELSEFTLTSIISACGLLMNSELSKQLHGFVTKFGFRSNGCIEAALLDMCIRCGRMKDAEKMFQGWPPDQDSSVIRTSMLCGYARDGLPEEAIALFCDSYHEGTMVMDEVALTSVISVCGTVGFHEMGKQIHCHAFKTGFIADLGVGNSIISMYSKCYSMHNAIKSFNLMPEHDIVSWNGLIAGFLLHRQGDEALAIWSRMESAGVKPDEVTFLLIISAYKHTSSNLVHDCHKLFDSMETRYSVKRTLEHYASLVSVLGHWGLLEDAEEMIIKMPFKPDVSVWRALLDSCRLHLNTVIGKRVAKHILALQPQDPSTFVLVSNLYSASGRWHCSEMVRENMKARGLRKQPCRCWIIDKKKIHPFYARDRSHPQTKDIYSGLEILILECLKAGYEPDTSFVLHEVEEHQKKDFLFHHSAKLAATYGLLMSKPGEVIRIVKNILLCGDCHTFLKHASVVTGREIILRDSSGFHRFSNGQCSCKDYW